MTTEQIGARTPDGMSFGNAITDKISMYGVTPIVQRSGAAQAAVTTTAATSTTPYGYGTAAQADAIVTLVNELRAAAIAIGQIKGSA
jgi:hypothetical protein